MPKRDARGSRRLSKTEEQSYYDILKVTKDVDEDGIKKAYRKMAVRWHPDKNRENKDEAEAMFKLVAEAYEVLSDPEKRRIYDRYGKEGLKPGGGSYQDFHDHFDLSRAQSLFEELFGSDPFFGGGFGSNFGDPFANFGFGAPSRYQRSRHGGLFNDFFGGGFMEEFGDAFSGGMSSSSSFTSSSFSSGGGGISRSTRTSTKIVNGRKITTTQTEVRYPDGRTETSTDEREEDAGQIGDGGRSRRDRLGWF